MSQPSQRVVSKIDEEKIKVGDLLTFVNYAKVSSVNKDSNGEVTVAAVDVDTDVVLTLKGKDLLENSLSAQQFKETKKVNKSEIAEIISSSYSKPFTVSYEKIDGSNRVLTGRLIAPEHLMGRSYVEDLSIPANQNRVRQVDHRTIEYLIVDNIKYVTK